MKTVRVSLLALVSCLTAMPETGHDAWLRYAAIGNRSDIPSTLLVLGESEIMASAKGELMRALAGLRATQSPAARDFIVIGSFAAVRRAFPGLMLPSNLIGDGYWLKETRHNGHRLLLVTAPQERGVLYGGFALLRHLARQERITDERSNPYEPVRWVNEWDNLDGSIQRGYAGRSIFFEDNNVVKDLTRASEYARLLASVGVNGCVVNNVNANPRVLTPEFLPQLARIAAVFRPWGVKLSISVPFNSPKTVGGLDTFDPQNARVQEWWKTKTEEIYKVIPDFGGFLVKADSEGQLGPSTYGRTHAEAANVLASALRPHGGILIYGHLSTTIAP